MVSAAGSVESQTWVDYFNEVVSLLIYWRTAIRASCPDPQASY